MYRLKIFPFNSALARMSVVASFSEYHRPSFRNWCLVLIFSGIFAASKKEKGMSVLVKGAPETIKPLLSTVSVFTVFLIQNFGINS